MNKPRIMLVEDEKVVAADIQECVRGLGYEVVGAATSGTEALRLAVKTEPDLVLMDIKLKGIVDGIDVAGALYEQLQIPVVYLTAHADAEILERAKQTAPSGYVLKPFDDRTLRTAIEIAFHQHHRERQLIESAQRLAAAIGGIGEAVIVTRENGQIAVMNRLAETLTGWKQEEAVGKPAGEVLTVLNALTGVPQPSPLGRAFREGISIGLGENAVLLSRDGARTLIQGSVSPIRDGEAETLGVCLLFRAAGQHFAAEPWGAPEHGSVSRLELLGRLTAAAAQRLAVLLEGNRGRTRATRLANRLVEFGRAEVAPPASLDVNALITSLDDLLRCALGDSITLETVLAPGAAAVKADPSQVELLLMFLALQAHDNAVPGEFRIQTAAAATAGAGAFTVLSVTPPGGRHNLGADLPALDEIARRSTGEVRISADNGAVEIYLPALG